MPVVHKPHPKCPACGRALYKAAKVGASVTKDMPYQYCRNVKCDYEVVVEVPEEAQVQVESAHVSMTRAALKKSMDGCSELLKMAHVKTVIVMLQELGHDNIAWMLISHYKLEKEFGIHETP